jgi:hypothetical protein
VILSFGYGWPFDQPRTAGILAILGAALPFFFSLLLARGLELRFDWDAGAVTLRKVPSLFERPRTLRIEDVQRALVEVEEVPVQREDGGSDYVLRFAKRPGSEAFREELSGALAWSDTYGSSPRLEGMNAGARGRP